MQDLIRKQPGVLSTRVGYTGGDVPNATYRNHGTHAEAIEITFDPEQTSYRDLLSFFFQIHDPTTLNRQGHDVGTQYRSAIFYHSSAQLATAKAVIAGLAGQKVWTGPIVTELVPFTAFYKAEDHHQHYYATNPGQTYCQLVVNPKVAKARRAFAGKMKA